MTPEDHLLRHDAAHREALDTARLTQTMLNHMQVRARLCLRAAQDYAAAGGDRIDTISASRRLAEAERMSTAIDATLLAFREMP